jgi:hypothetical protein
MTFTEQQITDFVEGKYNPDLQQAIDNNSFDRLSARNFHIAMARHTNKLVPWTMRAKLKDLAKQFDEQFPDEETYQKNKPQDKEPVITLEDALAAEDERIIYLDKVLDALFTPARREIITNYIITNVPNVISADLETIFDFTKANASELYMGDVNDLKEFVDFVITFVVTEAHKRVWLHDITKEDKDDEDNTILNPMKESMRTAIVRELHKVIDLVSDPTLDLDEILQSTLLLLCERFFDELKDKAGKELEKPLHRIARHNARIYTKSVTREAVKQRKLKAEDYNAFNKIFRKSEETERLEMEEMERKECESE